MDTSTTPRSSRRTSLTIAAAGLAAGAALFAATAGGAPAARAHAGHPGATLSRAAFHQAMDRLWEEHVAWTRMAIVSFAAGLPNLKATTARLLRNQVDIGNAIKPYYGAAAGTKLTSLLKAHILGAVTVLTEAKAGDKAKLNAAVKAWYGNAHQIAAFLSKANPKAWPLAATTRMMDDHLKLTTKEAVDELGGRYAASAADYDKIEAEILMMSDALASGIAEQFPSRFSS